LVAGRSRTLKAQIGLEGRSDQSTYPKVNWSQNPGVPFGSPREGRETTLGKRCSRGEEMGLYHKGSGVAHEGAGLEKKGKREKGTDAMRRVHNSESSSS